MYCLFFLEKVNFKNKITRQRKAYKITQHAVGLSYEPTHEILVIIKVEQSCQSFRGSLAQNRAKIKAQPKKVVIKPYEIAKHEFLTLYFLVSSADSLCKQFGPRSGPTKCRA